MHHAVGHIDGFEADARGPVVMLPASAAAGSGSGAALMWSLAPSRASQRRFNIHELPWGPGQQHDTTCRRRPLLVGRPRRRPLLVGRRCHLDSHPVLQPVHQQQLLCDRAHLAKGELFVLKVEASLLKVHIRRRPARAQHRKGRLCSPRTQAAAARPRRGIAHRCTALTLPGPSACPETVPAAP